jgi:outer membrane protein
MSFVKQQLVKVVLGIALVSAFAFPASAQELKIGFVNVPLLMERSPHTKAAMDGLQQEFAPRQREFVARQKEYEELATKVQKDVAVMGETERRNAEKNLRELQREVTRLQTEFREDLNLRQNEELGMLQRSLLIEVQNYAAAEGYDLVVGDSVLFASTTVNITEQILLAVQASRQRAHHSLASGHLQCRSA